MKKLKRIRVIISIIGIIILLLMVIFSSNIKEYIRDYKFEKKPRETMYCHFENQEYNMGVNRTQCMNIKYVSKEFNRINFTEFDNLNYTTYFCSKEISDVPDCHTENYYMSMFPLVLWMENTNSSIDGYACVEYQINFTGKNNPSRVMTYLSMFMQQKYDNFTEQRKAFIDCEGRD